MGARPGKGFPFVSHSGGCTTPIPPTAVSPHLRGGCSVWGPSPSTGRRGSERGAIQTQRDPQVCGSGRGQTRKGPRPQPHEAGLHDLGWGQQAPPPGRRCMWGYPSSSFVTSSTAAALLGPQGPQEALAKPSFINVGYMGARDTGHPTKGSQTTQSPAPWPGGCWGPRHPPGHWPGQVG